MYKRVKATMSENAMSENAPLPSNIPLEQIPIENVSTAVNLLYSYLERASKRGAFGLQESAKVMQCLSVVGSVAKAIDEDVEIQKKTTPPSTEAKQTAVEPVKPPQNNPGATTTQQQGVRKKS